MIPAAPCSPRMSSTTTAEDRHQQPDPQQEVQHHRRADALGGHGEGGVGARQPEPGQQPEPEGAADRRPAGNDVADSQRRQVDAEQRQVRRRGAVDHHLGQLGVAQDRARLQSHPQDDQPQVDLGEQAGRPPRPRDLGKHEIDHHEGDQQELDEAPDRRDQPRSGPGHGWRQYMARSGLAPDLLDSQSGQEPGQEGGAGDHAVEVQPLVGAVGLAAHRGQAVDGGQPGRRGGVGVPGPAGGRLADLEPEVAGDRLGLGDQRGHGLGALHRRVAVGRGHRGRGPSTVEAATIRSTSAMARSKASMVAALTSTRMTARSATTLVRLPPWSTPTLQVTPGQRPFRAWRATVLWAASRTALTPSAGRTPAWTALPATSTVKAQMPLRAETRAPLVRAASRPTATSCSAARASIRGRLNGEPISSSGEQTRVMAAKSSKPASSQRTSTASNPHTTPALSSVTPGPYARRPRLRNGRAAAVPASNTVSMWASSSKRRPPLPTGLRPARRPTTMSPSGGPISDRSRWWRWR